MKEIDGKISTIFKKNEKYNNESWFGCGYLLEIKKIKDHYYAKILLKKRKKEEFLFLLDEKKAYCLMNDFKKHNTTNLFLMFWFGIKSSSYINKNNLLGKQNIPAIFINLVIVYYYIGENDSCKMNRSFKMKLLIEKKGLIVDSKHKENMNIICFYCKGTFWYNNNENFIVFKKYRKKKEHSKPGSYFDPDLYSTGQTCLFEFKFKKNKNYNSMPSVSLLADCKHHINIL